MYCNSCGTEIEEGVTFCTNCGAPVGQAQSQVEAQPQQPELGMKWANFLGYFALWLGAIVNISVFSTYLTGTIYLQTGTSADVVYGVFPALNVLDKFYAICLLATSILGIVTALAIIKRKRTAGKLVCAVYLVSAIVVVIYTVASTLIFGQSTIQPTTVVSVVVSIVMIFVNRTYFANRANVFVN